MPERLQDLSGVALPVEAQLQRHSLPQRHADHPSRRQRAVDPADFLVLAARRRRCISTCCPASMPPDYLRAQQAARPAAELQDRARRCAAETLRAAPVRAVVRQPADAPVRRTRTAGDRRAAAALAAGRQRHRGLSHRRGHARRRRHRELSSTTMQSRRVPGLYFIGEVVDVTGWLGGYNFQWAWASGHAAGEVA